MINDAGAEREYYRIALDEKNFFLIVRKGEKGNQLGIALTKSQILR